MTNPWLASSPREADLSKRFVEPFKIFACSGKRSRGAKDSSRSLIRKSETASTRAAVD
jgi:hypothetical protein